MNRQLGAIFIVAGTSIGGGIIALPMTLASIGLLPTVLIMIIVWAVMFYSALINLELNLQAKRGLDIGNLAKLYGGNGAALVGRLTLISLMYALMGAYFYGLSSLIVQIFHQSPGWQNVIIFYVAVIFCVAMTLPIHGLDAINRIAFMAMLLVGALLVCGLIGYAPWDGTILYSKKFVNFGKIMAAVPVLFTSFGFQVVFHTISDYCAMNPKTLKRVFFHGSLIPLVVYIIWTAIILLSIRTNNPSFYDAMAAGNVDIGILVEELSRITSNPGIRIIIWTVSILAITTSVVGVGLGLCGAIRNYLGGDPRRTKDRLLPALIAAIPPCILSIAVPSAFVTILGFAGIILAILAIILPIYLLRKGKFTSFYYESVKNSKLLKITTIAAYIVIACEALHILL
jgi:tyrosine-specific transport protein